jgi:hypothetical protein
MLLYQYRLQIKVPPYLPPPINRFISVGKSEQVDADSNMLEKTKT